MGLQVKRRTIHDATFIEVDPGSSKKPRGEEAKTRRSRDGTWAKKGKESHFAISYSRKQMSILPDSRNRDNQGKQHDSQIDLFIQGEVVIRDRGYFGVKAKGIDLTMKRRTTDMPLDELDKERNRLISILGSPGERPHAVIKRVFGSGRVLVTTVRRVAVEMMVAAFAFSL